VLAAGLLLCSAAFLLLGFVGPDLFTIAAHCASFGEGLVRPALWASALVAFARPHEAGRLALCFAMWGAMNVASLLSTTLGSQTYGAGVEFTGIAAAALSTLAAGLAVLLLIGAVTLRGAPEERATEPTLHWNRGVFLAAAALLVLLLGPWTGLMAIFGPLGAAFYDAPPSPVATPVWLALNPGVVVWATALLAATFVLLAMSRRNVSGVRILGIGLVVCALGVGIVSVEAARASAAPLLLGVGLMSVGEAIAGPALLARLGGDLHWRAVTGVVAIFFGGGVVLHLAAGAYREHVAEAPSSFATPVAGAVSALVVGLALVVFAGPLQRRLYQPDVPADGARPAVPI